MKQTFKVPSGTKEVTFEQIDNTIVTTFVPETQEDLRYKNCDIVVVNEIGIGILDEMQKVHLADETLDQAVFYCAYKASRFETPAKICYTAIRYASKEESKHLFMQIEKAGLKWNEETRTLEELEWKPRVDGNVFTISAFLEVVSYTWVGDKDDIKAFENGFIFKTEQEAQALFDKVKQIAKNK